MIEESGLYLIGKRKLEEWLLLGSFGGKRSGSGVPGFCPSACFGSVFCYAHTQTTNILTSFILYCYISPLRYSKTISEIATDDQ